MTNLSGFYIDPGMIRSEPQKLTGQKIAAAKKLSAGRDEPVKPKVFTGKKRMSVGQAKIIEREQDFQKVLKVVRSAPSPLRDEVIMRLSFYCGIRAQEIAYVQWERNILTANKTVGDILHVTHDMGKRSRERYIPIDPELRACLRRLRAERPDDIYVAYALKSKYSNSQRAQSLGRGQSHPNTVVKFFERTYKEAGFQGCSSHTGRRTFITKLGRRCNEAQSSIRDVQVLAGHASLETTQGYMEPSSKQKKLVSLVY